MPNWPTSLTFLQPAGYPPLGRVGSYQLQQVVMIEGFQIGRFNRPCFDEEPIKGSQGWKISPFAEPLPLLGLIETKKRYFHSEQTESLVYSMS
jgi:hypothetical protein